jgi:acetyl-CoA carboxylase biotin carboxyl carrier protein
VVADLTSEVVEHALKTAREHGFAEVELSSGADTFRAKLDPLPKSKSVKATGSAAVPEPVAKPIKATLVGYYAPGPKPLRTGETVSAGDVVATISALGISNDVESALSGEIVEVLVQDGQAVEYGQPLAMVQEQV